MKIGFIGLGKMGAFMVERLLKDGHKIVAFDINPQAGKLVKKKGAEIAVSLEYLVNKLNKPRVICIMLPAGKPTQNTVNSLSTVLTKGDIVIDGGNSYYKDSIILSEHLKNKGLFFLDVGTSGGIEGLKNGYCLMIGGEKEIFKKIEPIFKSLASKDGYLYVGTNGAGHFVKMVHNGIEYGMMQSIAEGFAVMKFSPFNLDLTEVSKLYNHRSIIESRMIGWLEKAFEQYGEELDRISGVVSHTGEGLWTVKTAKELKVPVPVIEEALKFRIKSEKNPCYIGKILSALRNQFGGHKVFHK